MWLNYLIWCSKTNEIVPGDHPHFEWPYIQSLRPDYLSFLGFYIHDRDWKTAPIRLGSNRAWFNFFLNVNAKKGLPHDYDSLLKGATMFLEWHNTGVKFTLDWCLIFEDPEQFVAQLNSISDFDVKFNSVTEQAFIQYKNSQPRGYTDQAARAWKNAILNLLTDRKQILPQRVQQAEQIFNDTYYVL